MSSGRGLGREVQRSSEVPGKALEAGIGRKPSLKGWAGQGNPGKVPPGALGPGGAQ